jgi:hypothetical protein
MNWWSLRINHRLTLETFGELLIGLEESVEEYAPGEWKRKLEDVDM